MSTDAGSVRVNIFNQSYSLRSASGDGEHVERVARLVDERMRAVASGLAVHDVAKVAVLTALNLADELEGLRDFYETELRAMLTRAREEEEEEEEETAARASEASEAFKASEADDEPEPTVVASPTASAPSTREQSPAERTPDVATPDEPSWFDSIFDTDAPPSRAGEERLSSQVTSRLRSQVSARLRRLRQPSPGNSITEGESEE